MLFNIYHGLSGGFGGAQYDYTGDFSDIDGAGKEAYYLAREDYESYEGMHGIMGWEDFVEEYCEINDIDIEQLTPEDEDEIQGLYNEEIESWIDYYAIPSEKDDEIEPDDICMR